MKRGRKPRVSKTNQSDKEAEESGNHQNSNLCTSITDLPTPISIDILIRLSVKLILACKCVCKTWRNLISNAEFTKLHFARSEAYPLIRTLAYTHVSRTLYLLETKSGIERLPCTCDNFGDECEDNFRYLCDGRIKVDLETKLKIPLRNLERVINREGDDASVTRNSKGGVKRKRCVKLMNVLDHKLNVVNSCNGLLCLAEPWKNDPAVVCNPVTGEYINLPAPTKADERTNHFNGCGLGFSPQTNEFKVIRIYTLPMSELVLRPLTNEGRYGRNVAEIYTLSTGSWRSIGIAPSPNRGTKLEFPTYLNGALHWLSDCKSSDYLVAFGFDNEKFYPVPLPLGMYYDSCSRTSLGVLRGWLCICDSYFENIDIWVMEDYDCQGSWTKKFCLSTSTVHGRWLHGLYEPIGYLRNGAMMFFHRVSSAIFYYDSTEGDFIFLKLRGIKSKFEVIAHTPSFISLKEAVTGDNLAVLNIKSRCAGLKLPGETKALFLKEENADLDSDFNASD